MQILPDFASFTVIPAFCDVIMLLSMFRDALTPFVSLAVFVLKPSVLPKVIRLVLLNA